MNYKKFLQKEVEPFRIEEKLTAAQILEKMSNTAFQGRNLGRAARVWEKAISENVTILMGLSGAMVPAGMREIVRFCIEKKMIDVLVSTGANLFHDVHEALGLKHYQGSKDADDVELLKYRIDRIYDVFASEEEFISVDRKISEFASTLPKKKYTTQEFLYALGKYLLENGKEESILTDAARYKLPVFCPALGDSAIGLSLAEDMISRGFQMDFDIIRDVVELTRIIMDSENTGVIYVGGGTPKNYIQQTEVAYTHVNNPVKGHKYAVQLTTDSPQFGGLSGCTFEEAQSWGKIAVDAAQVIVFCDATIGLPLLASGVYEKCVKKLEGKKRKTFSNLSWD